MKKFLALLVLCLVAIGCLPARAPGLTFPQMRDSVVALVEPDEDDGVRIFCSGVWVGQDEILTAAHCVAHSRKVLESDLVFYQTTSTDEHRAKIGFVESYDEDHDLALVYAAADGPHPVAQLADARPIQGSPIVVMGHPRGLSWSMARGYVSGYRPKDMLDELTGPWMQLDVAISGGNSGGPAFDSDGKLVGLCHFNMPRLNGMGFFSTVETLKAHLDAARKNPSANRAPAKR